MNTILKNSLPVTLVFLASISASTFTVDVKQKPEPAPKEQKNSRTQKGVMGNMMQHFDAMMHDFNAFFDRHMCRRGHEDRELTVFDAEAVALPEVTIGGNTDDNDIVVQLKGLSLKKEDIKAEFDEEEGVALFTFPYKESVVTVRIYPRTLRMEAEKKITQEKKDAQGKILGSFNYTGFNSYHESWRHRVNVRTLGAEYKDGVLTIKIGASPIRRALSIK